MKGPACLLKLILQLKYCALGLAMPRGELGDLVTFLSKLCCQRRLRFSNR